MSTCGHVIDELADALNLEAESAIRQARSPGVPRGVSEGRSSKAGSG